MFALALAAVILLSDVFVATAGFQNQTAVPVPGFGDGRASWGDVNNDGYPDLINHDSAWYSGNPHLNVLPKTRVSPKSSGRRGKPLENTG